MSSPSIVGIRLYWRCATCGLIKDTHGLARAGEPVMLHPPEGWAIVDRQSYCGNHTVSAQESGGLFLVKKPA